MVTSCMSLGPLDNVSLTYSQWGFDDVSEQVEHIPLATCVEPTSKSYCKSQILLACIQLINSYHYGTDSFESKDKFNEGIDITYNPSAKIYFILLSVFNLAPRVDQPKHQQTNKIL